MIPSIHYASLDLAHDHYLRAGFEYIEVPWAVSKEAWSITSPPSAVEYQLGDKFLVASGEQGFLELTLQGKLPPGKYQTITPCFRNEKEETNLVRPYFMKLELIDTLDPTIDRLREVMKHCEYFFGEHIFCGSVSTELCETDPLAISRTYDIVSDEKEIELGSYGVREHPKVGQWVYATGCAEPRLSQACKIEK